MERMRAVPVVEALADLRAALRGEVLAVRRGERLRWGRVGGGGREYLAVEGGLEQPLPGLPLHPLRSGDLLRHAEGREKKNNYFFSARRPPSLPAETNREIRAMRGPQWDAFSGPELFFSTEWIVSPPSDPRGLRLQGRPLALLPAADVPPGCERPGAGPGP